MTQRGLPLLVVLLVTLILGGCGGGFRFRSKTGRRHDPVAEIAVRCEEPEGQLVVQAGGEVIGTISSKGRGRAALEELSEKAQRIAAKSGGTHIVLTERAAESFTGGKPVPESTCSPGTEDCVAVPVPTRAPERTASFVVMRLSPLKWDALPPALRPVRRD